MISGSGRTRTCRLVVTVVLLAGLGVSASGCGYGGVAVGDDGLSGSIRITGSNTVTPVSALWAEDFMKLHPGVGIAVSGPGSGVGIASLINGTTDIAQSSRNMAPREIERARANGVDPREIQIASDALSVVVHPDNPVSELTFLQISDIYTGKTTNWQDVGGDDRRVVALSRDTSSGTHIFFKEHVVQMIGLSTEDRSLEFGSRVLFLPSAEEGVLEVAKNPNAIFYPGLGYVNERVKPLAIRRTAAAEAVQPGVETALDGSYSIARPLLFYTNGEPEGVVREFIEYCLSESGQRAVLLAGFVPLR